MKIHPNMWNILFGLVMAPIILFIIFVIILEIPGNLSEVFIVKVIGYTYSAIALIFLGAYISKDQEGYVSTGGIIRGTIISLVFGFLMDAATGGTVRKGVLDLIGF